MAHVFDGTPDGRQSDEDTMPVDRFSTRYRPLTENEKVLHDSIKAKANELAKLYELVKAGRHRSLAFTDLESSVMRIIKELTS